MSSTGAASVTVKAALVVLQASGPMHYKAVAERLFAPPHNIARRGKDPAYTVYADMFFAVKANHPELRMVGRGVFALASHGNVSGSDYAPSRTSAPAPARTKTVEEMTDDELIDHMKAVRELYTTADVERKKRLAAANALIEAKKAKIAAREAAKAAKAAENVPAEAEVMTEAEPTETAPVETAPTA